jgi:hypothetical protein
MTTRRPPPDRLINRDPGPRLARVARRLARRRAMAERVTRESKPPPPVPPPRQP